MTYTDEVAASISAKKAVLATLPCTAQEKLLTTLSGYYEAIYTAEEKLEADLATAEGMTDQLPCPCSITRQSCLIWMQSAAL